MPSNDEVSKAVQAYMTTVARRYLPAIAFFAGIGLLIALVPSTSSKAMQGTAQGLTPSQSSGSMTYGSAGGPGSTYGSAGGPGSTATPGAPNSAIAGSVPAGSASAGGTRSSSGGGSTPIGGSTNNTTSANVARTGVTCGPGVRQVAWSVYAPLCTPAWDGNNGGATAPGVTATTITLTYRLANTSEQGLVQSVSGDAIVSDSALVADLNTYIGLFNRTFELYGRRVVLRPYKGQGDYVLEDEGQDLQGAQADAATARQFGAFGDATYAITTSTPYAQALVQQHVISFNTIALSEATYQQWAPYAYSYLPTADKIGSFEGNVICERLNGFPAIYAGTSAYQSTVRKFGVAVLDTPNFVTMGNSASAAMRGACGASFSQKATYPADASQEQQQAATIVAQMKNAGVTTLACFCDGAMMEYLSEQADLQNYHPEWLVEDAGDPYSRLPQQDQWGGHAFSFQDFWFQSTGVQRTQSEAYKAYRIANPSGQPQETQYSYAYFSLLQIFDALQEAGPDLTPASFESGMFSIPNSGIGDDSLWSFGQGAFTPPVESMVAIWSADGTSQMDGQKGTWVACEAKRHYSMITASDWGAPKQLGC